MFGAAAVHPGHEEVFSTAPEFIRSADGAKKNDCERNSARRFVPDLRREHPKMKAVILRDGLASNGSRAELRKARGLRFIPRAKADDRKFLFNRVERREGARTLERTDRQEQRSAWAADPPLDADAAVPTMRAARTRRQIANNAITKLKNRGCAFEHNFGQYAEIGVAGNACPMSSRARSRSIAAVCSGSRLRSRNGSRACGAGCESCSAPARSRTGNLLQRPRCRPEGDRPRRSSRRPLVA